MAEEVTNLSSFVWSIAEILRGDFKQSEYGKVILMIVTQGREHAVRYYFGVKDYIRKNGYTGLKALVAFSGEVRVDGGDCIAP